MKKEKRSYRFWQRIDIATVYRFPVSGFWPEATEEENGRRPSLTGSAERDFGEEFKENKNKKNKVKYCLIK